MKTPWETAAAFTAAEIVKDSDLIKQVYSPLGPLAAAMKASEFLGQMGGPSGALAEAMKTSEFLRQMGGPSGALAKAMKASGSLKQAGARSGVLAEMIQAADHFKQFGASGSDYAKAAHAVNMATRAPYWADALTSRSAADLATVIGSISGITRMDELRLFAGSIRNANGFVGADHLWQVEENALSATTLKMAMYAGATDVFGPGDASSAAAFTALLGRYRTPRADLDPAFWRDFRRRADIYRDAEVDTGLIDASKADTLEIMIESGMAARHVGPRSGARAALIEVGPLRMRITAGRANVNAYSVIEAFETGLRAFIEIKLQSAHGPLWFKRKVPGDVAERTKHRMTEAKRSGEAVRHPIDFVDLGDLIHILARNDNWVESFEATFQRRDWLKVDLERLTALRRPVMHARAFDGVQLVELMMTVRRLTSWMQLDGQPALGWHDDEALAEEPLE